MSSSFFEFLEARFLLTVSARFDYSLDNSGFFDLPSRREVLEYAASLILDRIGDSFLPIIPAGSNTWTAKFTHPATGRAHSIPNLSVAENEVVIYVGSRDLSGHLWGWGEFGGWQGNGSSSWLSALNTRGQIGASQPNPSDFGRWGGAIAFDPYVNWHFGVSTSGLESDEADFLSLAVHEVAHVLGFGVSDSWKSMTVGSYFKGAKSMEEYGSSGGVPLNATRGHWAEGTVSQEQEALMDPTFEYGGRKRVTPLDFAGLDDIGWDILPSVGIEPTDEVARETGSNRGVFRITRHTDDLSQALRVRYTITGTATNGMDYTEINSSVRINAGKSFATVVVHPVDDTLDEGTEQVKLYLKPSSAYGIDPNLDRARVNVRDNDGLGLRPSFRSLVARWQSPLFSPSRLFEPDELEDDLELGNV